MLAWSVRGPGFEFRPVPVLFYPFQFGMSVRLLQAAKGLSRLFRQGPSHTEN